MDLRAPHHKRTHVDLQATTCEPTWIFRTYTRGPTWLYKDLLHHKRTHMDLQAATGEPTWIYNTYTTGEPKWIYKDLQHHGRTPRSDRRENILKL